MPMKKLRQFHKNPKMPMKKHQQLQKIPKMLMKKHQQPTYQRTHATYEKAYGD
jgi:hypothetical protein